MGLSFLLISFPGLGVKPNFFHFPLKLQPPKMLDHVEPNTSSFSVYYLAFPVTSPVFSILPIFHTNLDGGTWQLEMLCFVF